MHFDISLFMTNQFVLMSLTVVLGLMLGKLKIGRFSLGTSGSLFVGLVIGWFVFKTFALPYKTLSNPPEFASKIISRQVISKDFFLFTLILFVAAVGLRASSNLGHAVKKYGFKLIILGFLLPFTGALTCYLFGRAFKGQNIYAVSGVFTGALTSSPGLAAALEAVAGYGNDAEGMVGFGYSVGYIPGVIWVILSITFLPLIFKINIEKEKADLFKSITYNKNGYGRYKNNFSVLSFSAVCFIGYILGSIKFHFGTHTNGFGLGLTGGVLVSALLLGYIGKIWIFNFRMDTKILAAIGDLALAIFLSIVGLKYGYTTLISLAGKGFLLVVIASAATLAAVLTGYFTGRYLFKMNWIILAGGICGSMTSTPGLGIAMDSTKSDDVVIGYGASYPFALIGMVIFTILLSNLPL
ncbi:MAG: hypothetical protein DRP57_12695 [Spirochaetes bacterium]|nr:MAG: hypothetical protein DRP57_12695 [Spirochaetota bacterium]